MIRGMKYKMIDYYEVRMKVKITTKRVVVEKRQKAGRSKIVMRKNWLKFWAEIFSRSFWDSLLHGSK